MTKHSRQHRDVVSAHERAHLNKFYNNKWGTIKVREGADARGDFDQCSICLSLAMEPMMCPKGHVYCKGCIYQFLLTAKQQLKKHKEAYETQEQEAGNAALSKGDVHELDAVERFEQLEQRVNTGISKSAGFSSSSSSSSKSKKATTADDLAPAPGYKAYETENGRVFIVDEEFAKTTGKSSQSITEQEKKTKSQVLPCFWLPSLTPDAKIKKVAKPEEHIRGPFGEPLKVKQLTAIKYTLTPEAVKDPKLRKGRFMCPISKKTLTNGSKCFLVKTTGDVLIQDGVKLILTDGIYKDKKVRSKDIIEFSNTGTGFAAGGARMISSMNNPAFTYA